MMRSKFIAGLTATLLCLVFVLLLAMAMVGLFDMEAEGHLPKIIAFATIGLWLGLYNWFKPKTQNGDLNQNSNSNDSKK